MEAYQLQQHAIQIGQAVSALIEMEAMKAANSVRESNNEAPAYSEQDFNNLLVMYDLGHNGIFGKSTNFF